MVAAVVAVGMARCAEEVCGPGPSGGGPGGIRTPDHPVMSRALCRAELRAHTPMILVWGPVVGFIKLSVTSVGGYYLVHRQGVELMDPVMVMG